MQSVIEKKSKFIKEQKASALFSSFGIKTPLSKIPLVLFCFRGIKNSIQDIKWMK